MKNLITIIVILISGVIFGQDYNLLIDINKYRQANGLSVLVFDENTHENSRKETRIKSHRCFRSERFKFWKRHNGLPKDSTDFFRFLKNNHVKVASYNTFINDYFDTELKITKESDVEKYILLYVIYDINRKEKLKRQVLNTLITKGSVNIIINKYGICYGFKFN